ncbi:CBF-domain-containing protein [Xylaria digitata]|nr:CBF-domain-containing protein [Xylaria digitata]
MAADATKPRSKPTLKRKVARGDETTSKRAKPSSDDESDGDSSDNDQNEQIFLLEKEIIESKKHYNNIATLLDIAGDLDEGRERTQIAAISLCRVFLRLLAQGNLTKSGNILSEREAVVVEWLRARLAEFTEILLAAFRQDETASLALALSMRLLQAVAQYMHQKADYIFPEASLRKIVGALVQPEVDEALRIQFVDDFVKKHDDIRFYTFQSIREILNDTAITDSVDGKVVCNNILEMLITIEEVPESNEQLIRFYGKSPLGKSSHKLNSLTQHKRQAQEAWLALMKLGLDKEQKKKVLGQILTIVPWFTQPELLMDFMTDCYDTGGSVSILALTGVLYLIRERNLDYPAFYTKLYSLLDNNILHSRHRARFFRLLDTALSSTHLPAALVASFIKRLSRLALHAPPAVIVYIVPYCYNLFKRHPFTTFMMHRVTKGDKEDGVVEDPFIPDEEDPMTTHAIDSCVWELVQLQDHYHPSVASIAKIISEQFTKQSYNLEDFLDHSYASLLEAELSKPIKKPPAVEFFIPKKTLFSEIGIFSTASNETELAVVGGA